MSQNGIVHVTSALYHPSSNGLAERAVQTVKSGLQELPYRKNYQGFCSRTILRHKPLQASLLQLYSWAAARRLRSRLDRLFPDLTEKVEQKQAKQAEQHDSSKPLRTFKVGDTVYIKDFSTTPTTWIPGRVVKVTGQYYLTMWSVTLVM